MPNIDGKTIFDIDAEGYDQARPSYPEGLVDEVVAFSGISRDGRILEVGCGTGKATVLFARRGHSMLCVEPGPNMVAVAREKLREYPGVEFQISAFEDWPVQESAFDLVIAASCFQWLPTDIALPHMAAALRPHGALALFWNRHPRPESPVYQEIEQAYKLHVPRMARPPVDPHADFDRMVQNRADELANSGLFRDVTVHRFPCPHDYTPQAYTALLDTYSDHRSLPVEKRQVLYSAVADIIDRHGGIIRKDYVAILYLAKKLT